VKKQPADEEHAGEKERGGDEET